MIQKFWILLGIVAAIELFIAIIFAEKLFPTTGEKVEKRKITQDLPDLNSTEPTIQSEQRSEPEQSTVNTNSSQIIDYSQWKLTLPIAKEKDSTTPLEIFQPQLATYTINPWFTYTLDKTGLIFRAPVNAPTTNNTNYARSELREMINNGKDRAAWSSTKGTHTMIIDQAITAAPEVKRHVVAGQIHDGDDDVIVIRLEYPNLYVNVDGENEYTLDSNYTLGKRFTVTFVASRGKTKVYYNNNTDPAYTLDLDYSGAYFKAGAYTQSNCERERDSSRCNDNNYGEVVIYDLTVTHE